MTETITVTHDTAFEIHKWFRFAAPSWGGFLGPGERIDTPENFGGATVMTESGDVLNLNPGDVLSRNDDGTVSIARANAD